MYRIYFGDQAVAEQQIEYPERVHIWKINYSVKLNLKSVN